MISKTDMYGNTTSIKRSIYGDISLINYADSSEVEHSYDSLRRLKEVRDKVGTTTIERDSFGGETGIIDHKGRTVSYDYDKYGNRSGITYPGGRHITYERDITGRTTRALSDDVEAATTYNENAEETGACRDYDDFFCRTRYTVPEGVLDENGRMEAFNNDLVIRYLDQIVVRDDGYELAFKAGVTVEVEI